MSFSCDFFSGLPHGWANQCYVVVHYSQLAAYVALLIALPWAGAWLAGRRGLVVAAVSAIALAALPHILLIPKLTRLDEEFRDFAVVASAVHFLAGTIAVALSAGLARRWLMRRIRMSGGCDKH